jgi:hypothetical protein
LGILKLYWTRNQTFQHCEYLPRKVSVNSIVFNMVCLFSFWLAVVVDNFLKLLKLEIKAGLVCFQIITFLFLFLFYLIGLIALILWIS